MDPDHEQRIAAGLEPLSASDRRRYACDCAECALGVFVKIRPGDPRPLTAISVARRFAAGGAHAEQLATARASAAQASHDLLAAREYGDMPDLEAASSAAAACALACHPEPLEAALGAARLQIEAAEVEAVGARAADRAWRAGRPGPDDAQRLRDAVEAVRAWQLDRLTAYPSA